MSDLKKMYSTLQQDPFPEEMRLTLGDQELVFHKRTWRIGDETLGLRYGENPDQPAALYELKEGGLSVGGVAFRGPGKGLVSALTEEHMIQSGKHPGKINLTDVDNGLNILQYLSAKPAAVILKPTAEHIDSAYFEVVAAPDYESGAVDILKKRKNLRILRIPGIADLAGLSREPFLDVKSLMDGGVVLQFSFRNRILDAADFIPATAEKDGNHFAARKPTKAEAEDLLFAWAVEAGVTSNSILMVRDGVTTAIGTGEQDRVGCVDLTIAKAHTKYADLLAFRELNLSIYELRLKARDDKALAQKLADIEARASEARGGLPGSAAVSDGFFPFRDGVDLLIASGVTAIAQPGGSIRDFEVIQAVNEAAPQVAMVFTGQRSFRH